MFEFVYTLGTSFNPFVRSMGEWFQQRARILEAVQAMTEFVSKDKDFSTVPLDRVTHLPVSNFYLAYGGVPSRDIYMAKSRLLRRVCPELNYTAGSSCTAGNKKVRVCFHSNFLTRKHSVQKDRHGIIAALSLDPGFEVYFSGFQDLHAMVQYTFASATYIKLDQDLAKMRDTLVGLHLDALVFCEIGMCPLSYYLAHMRIAPVQVNTWGHSDSCGIDTIDYFVSSELFEKEEDPQSHYSETLVLMKSLSTSYTDPSAPYRRDGRLHLNKTKADFGFGPDTHVYFCLQSSFKILPEFDTCLTGVLERDEYGVVWLMGTRGELGSVRHIMDRLPSRVSQRIHLFPLSNHHTYMGMMNAADVVLDIYPFGGCNSSFEAFSLDKPVVTRPSEMINGRFTAGMYLKMGLGDSIVESTEDYIDMAVRLACDEDGTRTALAQAISEKKHLLFNDPLAADEWKAFLSEKKCSSQCPPVR